MTWLLMQSQQMIAMTTIGAITTGVVVVWLLIRLIIITGSIDGDGLGDLIEVLAGLFDGYDYGNSYT